VENWTSEEAVEDVAEGAGSSSIGFTNSWHNAAARWRAAAIEQREAVTVPSPWIDDEEEVSPVPLPDDDDDDDDDDNADAEGKGTSEALRSFSSSSILLP